jgi:hypothetical protein
MTFNVTFLTFFRPLSGIPFLPFTDISGLFQAFSHISALIPWDFFSEHPHGLLILPGFVLHF